jgi:hypothetical protein
MNLSKKRFAKDKLQTNSRSLLRKVDGKELLKISINSSSIIGNSEMQKLKKLVSKYEDSVTRERQNDFKNGLFNPN